jgi:hypothetical protein
MKKERKEGKAQKNGRKKKTPQRRCKRKDELRANWHKERKEGREGTIAKGGKRDNKRDIHQNFLGLCQVRRNPDSPRGGISQKGHKRTAREDFFNLFQ